MKLIDCTYFEVGPLAIQNARATDDLDNNAYAVQETITGYIERYQDEFLNRMVGEALTIVIDGYLASGEEDASVEELCGKLRLPFAHYVYYKLVGDANQQATVTGLQLLSNDNTAQPPLQRMVRVWNDMVRLNRQFISWAETCSFDVMYEVSMITPINQYNL